MFRDFAGTMITDGNDERGALLQDYFAAKAMVAICQSMGDMPALRGQEYSRIAEEAYELADAMMAERASLAYADRVAKDQTASVVAECRRHDRADISALADENDDDVPGEPCDPHKNHIRFADEIAEAIVSDKSSSQKIALVEQAWRRLCRRLYPAFSAKTDAIAAATERYG